MQVCPAPMNPAKAVPRAATSTGVSGNTSTGDLPPSSRVAFAKRLAVASAMERPGSVPPVNTTLRTSGWPVSAAPALGPRPLTTLSTPSGMPASRAMSPSSMAVSGVCSDGLRTTELPVARAGARLFEAIIIGWLKEARIADHAEREAARVGVVVAAHRHHRVAVGQQQRRVVAVPLRQPGDLRLGLGDRPAVVGGLQLVEVHHVALDAVGEAVRARARWKMRSVGPA